MNWISSSPATSRLWTGAFSSEWSTNTLPSPKNWKNGGRHAQRLRQRHPASISTVRRPMRLSTFLKPTSCPLTAIFDSGDYTLKSTPGTFGIAGSGNLVINGGSLDVTNTNYLHRRHEPRRRHAVVRPWRTRLVGQYRHSRAMPRSNGPRATRKISRAASSSTTASPRTIDAQDNTVTFATPLNSLAGTLVKTGSGTLIIRISIATPAAPRSMAGRSRSSIRGSASSGNITFAGNSTLQWISGNTQDLSDRLVMTNGVAATIDTQDNDLTFATGFGNSSSGSLVKARLGDVDARGNQQLHRRAVDQRRRRCDHGRDEPARRQSRSP